MENALLVEFLGLDIKGWSGYNRKIVSFHISNKPQESKALV